MNGAPLRIYAPGDPPAPPEDNSTAGGLSPRLTLSKFFQLAFVPLWIEGRSLDPKTLAEYAKSVDWWAQLTGDPALDEIDDYVCAAFVRDLSRKPGRGREYLSSCTVGKHCRHINRVLALAGPRARDKANRKNVGLLEFAPILEEPAAEQPAPEDFSLAEVHALYHGAVKMTRPSHILGVRAVDWWRAIIVVCYFTGFRRGHLLSIQFSHIHPFYKGARVTVAALAGKRKKGLRRYLPPVAVEHVQRITTDRRWLFEWPAWPSSYGNLNDHFIRLLQRSGMTEAKPKFHGLRKTHINQMVGIDPMEMARKAQESAGHTTLDTTMGSYVTDNSSEMMLARATELLPCPVPPDFDRGEGAQLTLF